MITPSLETCKRLKECGWNKPTHFYHFEGVSKYDDTPQKYNCLEYFISAPTLEEVLNELPIRTEVTFCGKGEMAYIVETPFVDSVIHQSAVEAACELWITLFGKEKI